MDKIMKKIIHQGDCWIWTGCVNSDGYPKITRNYDCNIKGHRYVYQCMKGDIPKGEVIRHTCDNPLCLNPDHLISGTPTDNMMDRKERMRTQNAVSEQQNELIRELRGKGLSQRAVADAVGCSQGHVSRLERGFYKLSM